MEIIFKRAVILHLLSNIFLLMVAVNICVPGITYLLSGLGLDFLAVVHSVDNYVIASLYDNNSAR